MFRLFLALNLCFLFSFERQLSISGKIYDTETLEPLTGVNIQSSNSANASDKEGLFVITISNIPDSIVFNYIGYQTEILVINNKSKKIFDIGMKKKGFKNVYQLKGGILNYLKKIKKKDSLWKGECFVFDNRVSLKHELKQGTYSVCGGCRQPVSIKDKKSKRYEEGVSCPNCFNKLTKNQKSRFRMRQSQIYKAKLSGKKYNFQKEFN